jgi:hypothetical protein
LLHILLLICMVRIRFIGSCFPFYVYALIVATDVPNT